MEQWLASPHAVYIVAAYGVAFLILGGLQVFLWHSSRGQDGVDE